MAGKTGDLVLEGDMGELEGDAEMTEWSTLITEGGGKRSSKTHRSSSKQSARSSYKDKVGSKRAFAESDKLRSTKEERKYSVTTKKPYKPLTSTPSYNSGKSRHSHFLTKDANKSPEKIVKNLDKTSSDVSDIADIIGSLDSDSKKVDETVSKTHGSTDENNTDSIVKSTDGSAATSKRKPSLNDDEDSSKAKRTNKENDIKDESSKDGEERNEKLLEQDSKKEVDKMPLCLEEVCRNVDAELVDEMMESARKELMPKHGEKYTVRFSPVELADLADETVQKLAMSQPNLAFYFKRQGKLKKKKGYAEVYLTQMQEARIFIQKLLQIKLVENCMEVSLTISKPKKDDEVLSLNIWLNKNNNLVKLIKSTEDAAKVLPGTTKEHFQIEKVPAAANALMLRTLFPCAAQVMFSAEQKVKSGYRGPVSIYFANISLLEAVLDCCSDFTYCGLSLPIQYKKRKQENKTKPATDAKKDAGTVSDRRNSTQDKARQGGSAKEDVIKAVKDSNSSSGIKSETTASVSTPLDATLDADISNMTLDVCTGMMESLNKLRQLGTDNPNIIKILEMQNQLATLQQSLSVSKDPDLKTSADSQADPWTVSATEGLDDSQLGQGDGEKGLKKKVPKEQKRKQDKESRAEKQRKEMEDLQRMIEEADEAKRQREEKVQRQLEIEKQKIKELDEKRKSSWARRMLEDAKQSSPNVGAESAASKEEVQRILKIIGSRRKDAEEAKKLEEERLKVEGEDKSGSQKTEVGQDEQPQKTSGQDTDGAQTSSDVTLGGRESVAVKGGSMSGKETSSDVSLSTLDTSTGMAAWSPDRTLQDGVPIYSEQEFGKMSSESAVGVIQWDHYIQVTYYSNRRCPVQMCPSTKYFKTASSFAVHWDVFHKPNVTVKFCQKCSAYFTTTPELEAHLANRHEINDPQIVKIMSEEAREKVVSNPSFRNPGRYLGPLE